MIELGYGMSSEEHSPNALIENARRAEEVGFSFAMISDHYHPWIDRQGHSPFVWTTLGGIAHATTRLRVGTGVTCPIIRYHPAIIAQAAATVGCLMPGRFMLGLGTGEALNEHITGERWPAFDERAEMLEEAVAIIRQLWQGGMQSYDGIYYTVENARVYDLPQPLPPIYLAASGPKAGELAGRLGEGLISTGPDPDVVHAFEGAGGHARPKLAQIVVCWAEDEAEARRTAHEKWPNAGLPGELSQQLPLPAHYEEAVRLVTEEKLAEQIVCGPDVDRHLERIQKYQDAGFDHIYIGQIGPDQEGFFRFYEREILPRFRAERAAA
jgi:coenzyme F420-dependent glucose-6-phosphate dehydrogenase